MKSMGSILVLSSHCTTFVEESVRACSSKVKGASVIVHHNPLSEMAALVPLEGYFSHVRKFTKKAIVPQDELPGNARLHIVSFPYLTPDNSNRKLADKVAKHAIKLVDKERLEFDLIHAHFTWPHGVAAVRMKERYGVPLVVTGHGTDVYDLPFRDAQWSETIGQALNRADQIITVSNSNAKSLERLNVKAPVTVIPNGFRADTFHPLEQPDSIKARLDLPLDKRIILTVGRLVPVKGHDTLIEAARVLTSKFDDLLFVIVGSGQLRPELSKKVSNLDLSEKVIFTGNRPHAEIPLWMNACDVFALPSFAEGNPTVMFECLGCGRPFVGSKVGGIPDIITSDDLGYLCEPGDSNELAEKLARALERRWDQERIVSYSSRFTWDSISDRIIEAYRKAMDEKIS